MTSSSKTAKKLSGQKLPEWGCSVVDCKVDTRVAICEHLERLLPQMRDGALPLASEGQIGSVTFDIVKKSNTPLNRMGTWEESEREYFLDLVKSYGFFQEWDVDLIKARFFYGMSYRKIAESYDYVSHKTVERRLKTLLRWIEERGFKPRSRK